MTNEENIKRNKELVKKYPFLKFDYDPIWAKKVSDKKLYDVTWLDDIDDGWRKAFGKDFCEELLQALKDDEYMPYESDDEYMWNGFHFIQIKEKFGALRIYYNGHPSNKYRTRDTIAKYEELSKYICGHCGKPARYITSGWIYPLCEDCVSHVNGDYTPIEEFYGFDSYNDVLNEIDSIKNNFQYDRYWKSIYCEVK